MKRQTQKDELTNKGFFITMRKLLTLETLSTKQKWITFIMIISSILCADMLTKYWAEQSLIREIKVSADKILDLQENETLVRLDDTATLYVTTEIVVIPHFWSFNYLRNYNIGFSLLRFLEKSLTQTQLIRLMTALQASAVLVLTIYFIFSQMIGGLSLMLIISGGFANVLDRMIHGYVIDFVKWSWENSPWPIFNPWPLFNFADVSISLGSCLLVWSLFIRHQKVH